MLIVSGLSAAKSALAGNTPAIRADAKRERRDKRRMTSPCMNRRATRVRRALEIFYKQHIFSRQKYNIFVFTCKIVVIFQTCRSFGSAIIFGFTDDLTSSL